METIINHIRLGLFVVLASLSHSSYSSVVPMISQWNVTIDPEQVMAGLTQNATIRCERNTDYIPGQMTLWWLRLSKKVPDGWRMIAEQKYVQGTVVSEMNVTATGNLGQSGGKSYLEVSWPMALQETFGIFKCECFVVWRKAGFAVERSKEIKVDETITIDLLSESWDLIKDDLLTCPATEGSESRSENFNIRMSEFIRQIKQYNCSEDPNHATWITGNFGVPKPDTGCPLGFSNTSSYIKIHEESSGSCHTNTQTTHLSKPIDTTDNSQCFTTLRFCESTGNVVSNEQWPEGKYCLNKMKTKECPNGFSASHIDLDAEDTNTVHDTQGNLTVTETIYFCCKHSGSTSTPMIMPIGKPFFLYRTGGTCQQIKGMKVIEEYVDIDAEDGGNNVAFHGGDPKPDILNIGSGSPIRIYLCYYTM